MCNKWDRATSGTCKACGPSKIQPPGYRATETSQSPVPQKQKRLRPAQDSHTGSHWLRFGANLRGPAPPASEKTAPVSERVVTQRAVSGEWDGMNGRRSRRPVGRPSVLWGAKMRRHARATVPHQGDLATAIIGVMIALCACQTKATLLLRSWVRRLRYARATTRRPSLR